MNTYKKRAEIVEILKDKTCIVEGIEEHESARIVLANKVLTEICNKISVLLTQRNEVQKLEGGTYKLSGEGSITLSKRGSTFEVKVRVPKKTTETFECEKYEVHKDENGIHYLSVFYNKDSIDPDYAYTLA